MFKKQNNMHYTDARDTVMIDEKSVYRNYPCYLMEDCLLLNMHFNQPYESFMKDIIYRHYGLFKKDKDPLIEKLEKVGVDINKFGEKTAKEIQKLFILNANRKENNAEEKRIKEEKITELKQEREILKERGINTYINEENFKLEIKTKQQEKLERIEIIRKEKELQQRERGLKLEAKQIQSAESIDLDRQERFIADQENLTKDQLQLQKQKEAAGMRPDESAQGFLSQTFGAAFSEIKNFGGDLKAIGKSVKDTFGELPDMIGGLVRGFGTLLTRVKLIAVAMLPAIMGFLMLAAPFIAVAVAVGLLLFNLNKIINWFRESALGRLLGLDKESKEKKQNEELSKRQNLEKGSNDVMNGMDEQMSTGTVQPQPQIRNDLTQNKDYISPFTDEAEKNIIIPDSLVMPTIKTPAEKRAEMRARGQIPRGDLGPLDNEGGMKGSTNNVIAPSNNVITTNTTNQSMGILPNNFDPTFLNLNKVSV
jgi:hypothetical protein